MSTDLHEIHSGPADLVRVIAGVMERRNQQDAEHGGPHHDVSDMLTLKSELESAGLKYQLPEHLRPQYDENFAPLRKKEDNA